MREAARRLDSRQHEHLAAEHALTACLRCSARSHSSYDHGQIQSDDATYVARTRLPISQNAGQSPPMCGAPGSRTELSMMPPVKQNLFHPWIIALRYVFVIVFFFLRFEPSSSGNVVSVASTVMLSRPATVSTCTSCRRPVEGGREGGREGARVGVALGFVPTVFVVVVVVVV